MKDKVLKILKIIGIIVFFPFLLLVWFISVLVNSILRVRDKKLVNTPNGEFVEVNGHKMSVGQRRRKTYISFSSWSW